MGEKLKRNLTSKLNGLPPFDLNLTRYVRNTNSNLEIIDTHLLAKMLRQP